MDDDAGRAGATSMTGIRAPAARRFGFALMAASLVAGCAQGLSESAELSTGSTIASPARPIASEPAASSKASLKSAATPGAAARPAASGTQDAGDVLSPAERASTCAAIEIALKGLKQRVVNLEAAAKAEREAAAPTLARFFARVSGQGGDSKSEEELAFERARGEAFLGVMRSKSCATAEVEALLAAKEAPKPAGQAAPVAPSPAPLPNTADLSNPDLQQVALPRGY